MIDTAFRNRLEAWFRRRVGDLSLAEDLTQETLLRALVGRDRAAAAGAVFHPGPAWWFKTARSVLIDAYRARGRRRSRLSPLSAFENDQGELALAAPDSLRPEGAAETAETALPPAYREVVTAGLAGGEPQSVWAQKRGLSPNTVKTRWARGKARLRTRGMRPPIRPQPLRYCRCKRASAVKRIARVQLSVPPLRRIKVRKSIQKAPCKFSG